MNRILAILLLGACGVRAQVDVVNKPIDILFNEATTNVNVCSNNWSTAQVGALLSILAEVTGIGATNGTVNLLSNSAPPVPCPQVAVLVNNGWTITCAYPIITNDTTFVVNGDGTWKLTVGAHGSGTTYQWQWYDPNVDWTDSGGETSATYNNPPRNESIALDPDIQRLYRCAVTRSGRTLYSAETLLPVPRISQNPTGADLTVGQTYSTECIGSTTDNFGNGVAITWKKNGVLVTGASTQDFSIPNVQVGDAGSYTCTFTMSNGAKLTSSAAVLTVSP